MRRFDVVFDESRRGLVLACFRGFLRSLSVAYGLMVWHRAAAYRIALFKRRSLDCFVVSVGNITLGGTGKTPLVMTLARRLTEHGCRVAVLSGGYRGTNRGVCVVSDGYQTLVSRDRAGDEPCLLAQQLPGVPVVVGRDRYLAGRLAVEWFAPDVVLLDDGFQHLKLDRDLDIVAIDGAAPLGNDRLLPRGPLREPVSALKRADVFCVTHTDPGAQLDGIRKRLESVQPAAPMLVARHRPTGLRALSAPTGNMGVEVLQGKPVFAFSGIGKPESFRKTLETLGCQVVGSLSFPDHHVYSANDLEAVAGRAQALKADYILTTAKDAVRIPADWEPEPRVLVCDIELEVEGIERLLERIVSCVEARRK